MNEHIKQQFLNGNLVLLLGAGASLDCKTYSGDPLPSSSKLAQLLAEGMGLDISGESLSDVYAAAQKMLGSQVNQVFDKHFRNTQPSKDIAKLVKYPLTRIYTLNIDDSFERALVKENRNFSLIQRDDPNYDRDQFFERLDLIKLNGDVNRKDKGFIFSAKEYAQGSASNNLFWYKELARDFFRFTFIFIGTSLNEELFEHHIELYKAKASTSNLRSYILTPEISTIQKITLENENIQHIKATLSDFIGWLECEFNSIPTSKDILVNIRPELKNISFNQQVFLGVTPVTRTGLTLKQNNKTLSTIRDFYKGFKPTWDDILESIPAWLDKVDRFFNENFVDAPLSPGELYLLKGPAGCGKTTALMQTALKLSEQRGVSVFYIDENYEDLSELIRHLDAALKSIYFIVVERLANLSIKVSEIIPSSKYAVFIGAENSRIWESRVVEHLGHLVSGETDLTSIADSDADLLLEKIEAYGSWTRLSKMTLRNRKLELLNKAKNQLLIGMLEVTYGEGFSQIIQREFNAIVKQEERMLVLLTGLATLKRVDASESSLMKALEFLELSPNVQGIASNLMGVLTYRSGKITTRHRVYIEKLFERFIGLDEIYQVIRAYLYSFVDYRFPFAKSMSKSDFEVYKFLVNAKSLRRLLKNNQTLITQLYQEFEKSFELEGLFLMQYGLALRYFGLHQEAYQKLLVANDAFSESPHIRHALAHQRIILAENETSESAALDYFYLAEEALTMLFRENPLMSAGGRDKYPIITLSEGHIKILLNFDKAEEAKVKAAYYYNLISKETKIANDPYVKSTLARLMKASISGVWHTENIEGFR